MTYRSELSPSVLLRIAGGACNDLLGTELSLTNSMVIEIIRYRSEIQELGHTISEDLYTAIPVIQDPSSRRFWLTIKRNAHNQRLLPRISRQAYAELPEALQKLVRRYNRLQKKLASLEEEAGQQYISEVKTARQAFAALLRKPNFRNGLLLSSATIGPSLETYLESALDEKPSVTKKERSFMEYLSRMYTKPTPFSSFTHLAIATFPDDRAGTAQNKELINYGTTEATSHVQLNHDLYKYLSDLLIGQQETRRRLPIKLNPTIKKTEGAYHFLVNHHNREAFQHITATPSLDVFYTLVARASQAVSYQEIIAYAIDKKYIKASAKETEKYVDQLIDLGFFEIELGISGIDREWDKKLAMRLSSFAGQLPQLAEVSDGLIAIRKLATQYKTATTARRQLLLRQAHETFKKACKPLEETLPKQVELKKEKKKSEKKHEEDIFKRAYLTDFTLKPHQMWYEDTALKAQPALHSALKSNLQTLGDLLARLRQFDGCLNERERITDFFKASYGTSATVDLLELYRDYFTNNTIDEQHLSKTQNKRNKANRHALEIFDKNLENGTFTDEVHFNHSAVEHLEPTPPPASFGAFLHTYGTGNDSRLVLSDTTDGYGKMFSRFLYLFDSSVTAQIQQVWNDRSKDILFAEVTDASFFNANLHPRIMPYEIITPGGHTALQSSAQLHVNDLVVSYDNAQEQLVLTHQPSRKRVVAFDLGFQGKNGRSKLYALLCNFSPGPHHNAYALLDSINTRVKTTLSDGQQGISILPRIIYEDRIVLQRKTWQIPKEKLPIRAVAESDWDYFLRMNQWRQELQMPDEVFIRGAHYKPQYISFRNPFLAALFASNARNCKALRVEEMLPNSGQLATTGGRTTELLAQWNNV